MMQPNPPKPLEKIHGHSLVVVRLIAAGKLFKALSLLALGFGLHYMIAPQWHQQIADYINVVRPDPHNHYLYLALSKLLSLKRGTLQVLRIGSFVYSALYFTESMGLFFDQAWAEWMLVITTAGFLPLEIYELAAHTSWLRMLVFALNVAMLLYIILRLRWRHLARIEARSRQAPIVTRDTTPSGIKP